ncbi:hypothetical protein QBC38DRAFT_26708 [Podospora fimiseda]|uniref:Peptidase S8/S53 domain-containing protein n=1 Tax=Podospora fimiseda TaxID=252190 RepID=A0AAN7BII1_9PEZI|nr:hypothetical protein QBC38DRAFT_26708 [Podospora fimiseda]
MRQYKKPDMDPKKTTSGKSSGSRFKKFFKSSQLTEQHGGNNTAASNAELDLILDTLPVLKTLAGEASDIFGIRDRRYDLLARIQTVAFLLESQLCLLKEPVSNGSLQWSNTEIRQVADLLERILTSKNANKPTQIQDRQSGSTSWTRRLFYRKGSKRRDNSPTRPPSRHPRLSAIRDSGASEKSRESTHQQMLDDLSSYSFNELQSFLEQFQRISPKSDNDGAPDEALSTQEEDVREGGLPEVAFREFVADAFAAIVCSSDCLETPNREVHLNLAAYNNQNQGTSDLGYLSLVAEYHQGARKDWREIALHAAASSHSKSKERMVKFADADASDVESTISVIKWPIEEPVACLCDCIRLYHERPSKWCFNLELQGSRLTRFWLDPRKRNMPEHTRDQITLRALVSNQRHSLSLSSKMSLSLMLAYSLFYLYSEPWLERIWDRDHILLTPNVGGRSPPQPFLRVVSWAAKGKHGEKQCLISPQLLELGVMLMEIHFGQSLEQILNDSSTISRIEDLQASASVVFNKALREGKLQERTGLRRALRICLSQGVRVTGRKGAIPTVDIAEVQKAIFKEVVKPLEQDLEISGFKTSAETPVEEMRSTDPEPVVPKNQSVHMIESGPSNSTAAAITSQDSAITDKWMLDFSRIVDTRTPTNAPTVKIAFLDTGIDSQHQDFDGEDRIKEFHSWTESPADTDTSGHGTHVTSTFLQLAGQNVEIYIGKISENMNLHSSQADQIAEAIDHAATIWDVDIISMSFGFGEKFDSIEKAIHRAVNKQKIVFAAASNEGGNRTRTFPATHPRVICIHSADGYGNPSKFNPTAIQYRHNFCALGEHIEAACPRANEDNFGGVTRESGTSFATPVAVAIATFLIGFVTEEKPDSKFWKTPVKSPEGVMRMFEEMSGDRGLGYSSINILKVFHDSAAGVDEFLARIRNWLERR